MDSYDYSEGAVLVVLEGGLETSPQRPMDPADVKRQFFASAASSLLVYWNSGSGMSRFKLWFKTGILPSLPHLTFYLCCLPLNNRTSSLVIITKTCPYNVYPLKPHFYIAKLGYAGVYLFFLFLLQNVDCGYSLEPPRRGGSNVYPQSMF